MVQKNSKEVFTLFLRETDGYVSDARVIFEVNYDALFNGRDKLYRKCQVRGNWMTTGITATQINNLVGVLELQGCLSGYLLGDSNYPLLCIIPLPTSDSGGGIDGENIYASYHTSYTGVLPIMNSLNQKDGLQTTNIPSGIQRITLNQTSVADNLLIGYTPGNFVTILQFELYN